MRVLVKDDIILTPKDSKNVTITLDGADEYDLKENEVKEVRKNLNKLKQYKKKDRIEK